MTTDHQTRRELSDAEIDGMIARSSVPLSSYGEEYWDVDGLIRKVDMRELVREALASSRLPVEGAPASSAQVTAPSAMSDEEIEDLAHSTCQEALSFGLSVDVIHRALRSMAKRLRAAPPAEPAWISVDAEKPTPRTVILVAVGWVRHHEEEDGTITRHEGVDVTEGEYVGPSEHGQGYFDSFQGKHGDSSGVTHWMPLPARPSSGTEAGKGETT